jgi:hypothetical protein
MAGWSKLSHAQSSFMDARKELTAAASGFVTAG